MSALLRLFLLLQPWDVQGIEGPLPLPVGSDRADNAGPGVRFAVLGPKYLEISYTDGPVRHQFHSNGCGFRARRYEKLFEGASFLVSKASKPQGGGWREVGHVVEVYLGRDFSWDCCLPVRQSIREFRTGITWFPIAGVEVSARLRNFRPSLEIGLWL